RCPPAPCFRRDATRSSCEHDPPESAASPPQPRRKNARGFARKIVHYLQAEARLHERGPWVGASARAFRWPFCVQPGGAVPRTRAEASLQRLSDRLRPWHQGTGWRGTSTDYAGVPRKSEIKGAL